MNRAFIRKHITTIAIIIYITIYACIIYTHPAFLYNHDGSLRTFGIGFRRKTIFPAWLLAIAIAILSYFIVLYYLAAPKLISF